MEAGHDGARPLEMQYGTTYASIWITIIALPFCAVFIFVGVAVCIMAGIKLWALLFIFIGSFTSIAVLNSSWSRTRVTAQGIRKQQFLFRMRAIDWNEIHAWYHDRDFDNDQIVFVLHDGRKYCIQEHEVAVPGPEHFLEDLRDVIGELELDHSPCVNG